VLPWDRCAGERFGFWLLHHSLRNLVDTSQAVLPDAAHAKGMRLEKGRFDAKHDP